MNDRDKEVTTVGLFVTKRDAVMALARHLLEHDEDFLNLQPRRGDDIKTKLRLKQEFTVVDNEQTLDRLCQSCDADYYGDRWSWRIDTVPLSMVSTTL